MKDRRPAGQALRRAHLAYRLALDRALAPVGVTTPQLQALLELRLRPGMSSAELARRCQVTPQTMKDVVRNLEMAGRIARSPHAAHGRILRVHLTDEGRRLLESCEHLADRVEECMLAALTAAERAQLVELLRRASDQLG
jgi:DNA-binding MarR family transcriptional regulator